jgi:hypothetical protein
MLKATEAVPMDDIESQFVEQIRAILGRNPDQYDGKLVAEEQAELRQTLEKYFHTNMQWAATEIKKPRVRPDHVEAMKYKRRARESLGAFQAALLDMGQLLLDLERYPVLVRSGQREMSGKSDSSIKWASDTGILIGRTKKQRSEIIFRMETMDKAYPVLKLLEADIDLVISHITLIMGGADKAEPLIRKTLAALRKADSAKFPSITEDFKAVKDKLVEPRQIEAWNELSTAWQRIMSQITIHQAILDSGDEGKMFLRLAEWEQAFNNNIQELKKIRLVLLKYNAAFMEYKMSSLSHLREKLVVMGSFESAVALYRRLLVGLATPMYEMGPIRQYESDVIAKVSYLLSTQAKEVTVLRLRMKEIVAEFKSHYADILAAEADGNRELIDLATYSPKIDIDDL